MAATARQLSWNLRLWAQSAVGVTEGRMLHIVCLWHEQEIATQNSVGAYLINLFFVFVSSSASQKHWKAEQTLNTDLQAEEAMKPWPWSFTAWNLFHRPASKYVAASLPCFIVGWQLITKSHRWLASLPDFQSTNGSTCMSDNVWSLDHSFDQKHARNIDPLLSILEASLVCVSYSQSVWWLNILSWGGRADWLF